MKALRNLASMLCLALLAGALVAASACHRTYRGPGTPRSDERATEMATQPVVLLDTNLQRRVASDQHYQERTSEGLLRAAAILRNRTNSHLRVQARTVFRDEEGLSTGDETAWENVFLSPRQSTTYHAVSRTPQAQSFTVEVRMP